METNFNSSMLSVPNFAALISFSLSRVRPSIFYYPASWRDAAIYEARNIPALGYRVFLHEARHPRPHSVCRILFFLGSFWVPTIFWDWASSIESFLNQLYLIPRSRHDACYRYCWNCDIGPSYICQEVVWLIKWLIDIVDSVYNSVYILNSFFKLENLHDRNGQGYHHWEIFIRKHKLVLNLDLFRFAFGYTLLTSGLSCSFFFLHLLVIHASDKTLDQLVYPPSFCPDPQAFQSLYWALFCAVRIHLESLSPQTFASSRFFLVVTILSAPVTARRFILREVVSEIVPVPFFTTRGTFAEALTWSSFCTNTFSFPSFSLWLLRHPVQDCWHFGFDEGIAPKPRCPVSISLRDTGLVI